MNQETCDIYDCKEQVFATETVTADTNVTEDTGGLKLCKGHFKHYFGRIAENAEIIDTTEK